MRERRTPIKYARTIRCRERSFVSIDRRVFFTGRSLLNGKDFFTSRKVAKAQRECRVCGYLNVRGHFIVRALHIVFFKLASLSLKLGLSIFFSEIARLFESMQDLLSTVNCLLPN